MKALIGKKMGMTQIFNESGTLVPVTLLSIEQNTVTHHKTIQKDGYSAIQIGAGKAKQTTKPMAGHLKAAKVEPRVLMEVRADDELPAVSTQLGLDQFEVGDEVTVSAVSKGKGFAGTIKRHNFARGPMTHGSNSRRDPGSIGSMYPQKIFKGKKMAGRMGNEQVTLRAVPVVDIDAERNLIAIKGPVPGPVGTNVLIRSMA